MTRSLIRIATRKSPLAMWQAEHVREALSAAHPGLVVELLTMTTQGDKILDSPLAKIGGKGLFVKELETSLIEGRADIAVHSMKDVPVELPEGLELAVVLAREEPRDALVSNRFAALDALPVGARLGTSSLRRRAQIAALRPDLDISSLRGNVGTRLQRLDEDRFDAILLAAAGLRRLGLGDRITTLLDIEHCLPAIGQGAIGIECRRDDPDTRRLIAVLEHPETHVCVRAERAMNARLEGGCQVPIGGHAILEEGQTLYLRGLVGDPSGAKILRGAVSGPAEDAERLGTALAEELLARGADKILQAVYAGG